MMKKKEVNREQEIIQDRRYESRSMEKRSFDSRKMEGRPRVYGQKKDHLEAVAPRDGYEQRWIRSSVFGEPDDSRMSDAQDDGWRPVPTSRNPGKTSEEFFGRSGHVKGFYERKGGILCEREKYLGDEEREYYSELNRRELQAVPCAQDWTAHPAMPGFVQTSRTERGSDPFA